MNVTEFCQNCIGKWFSQRTTHAIPPGQMEASRADLYVDRLEAEDPQVTIALGAIAPNGTVPIAMRSRWEGTVGANPDKQKGSAILAIVPQSDTAGAWVRQLQGRKDAIVTGRYQFVNSEHLTLTAKTDNFTTEERWWFAGENLRERTSIVTYSDGTRIASFFSEIRMGQPPKTND